jgi:AraC family ethanolamine operon transcriptional activator
MRLSALQVRQDLFEATRAAMRRDDLDDRFLKQDVIHLPTTLSVYRGYMQELMQLIEQQSPLLQRPDYHQMIFGDVFPLLIDAIPRREPKFRLSPHPRHQAQLVRRAREYIAAHIHEPLTLKDLYAALGVSRRTLFYSFESVFGVTPMEYIKVQRLQGARRMLKQANPTTASVAAVAHQWGFWHSGLFAKAYKAMFGELPSETLRK